MLPSKGYISPWCARVKSICNRTQEKQTKFPISALDSINCQDELNPCILSVCFEKKVIEEVCYPSYDNKTCNFSQLQSDKYTTTPRKGKEVDREDPKATADTHTVTALKTA